LSAQRKDTHHIGKESIMNTNQDTTSAANSMPTPYRHRPGPRLLTWLALLALIVPVLKTVGQGTIFFNNRIAGASFNQTGHIWAPSSTSPGLSLIGLGSNDNPSGTTPFGSASGMVQIGAVGSGGQYGYRTTFAQLIGALGQNMPESALVPLAGVTTFRTGVALGCVAFIYSTFTNNPASLDAPWATVEIVAWDNNSGLYPTWAQASVAWEQGLIPAGHSAAFNVANISGPYNPAPYLTSAGTISGFSFNLYFFGPLGPALATLPATAVTVTNATLNGTVNPNGYPTVAWFEWGTSTSYGNLTDVSDMGSGTNAQPVAFPLAGLTHGVTYHFRVAATNSNRAAYGSDQSFTTLGLPAVWTLSATDMSATNATLNATVNPNGYLTDAWFEWGTTTNYGGLTAATALGSGTNDLALSVPLAELTPGTTYHCRVVASNSPNAVYGSDQSFTTATVPSPQVWTLSATGVTASRARLNGTVTPNGYPTAAWFEWGTSTSYGNLTAVTSMGSGTNALPLAISLSGLTTGDTYHFRVVATNAFGTVYGGDQSFTPAALAYSGLQNGDFEAGNVGFMSGYTFSPGNLGPAGTYDVVTNPHLSHSGSASFGDHTTGHGLMLALNGSSDPSRLVWGETVSVAPASTYFFSGWAATWGTVGQGFDPSPPVLRLVVNGQPQGTDVQLQATNGQWQNLTFTWGSEMATQAVLQIFDLNPQGTGNDFALDDLFFGSPLAVECRPSTQTGEQGSTVTWLADAFGSPPLFYQWFHSGTNVPADPAHNYLTLPNVQFSQAGAWTVVVTNLFGAVTSSPAMLSVIEPVEHRSVPSLTLMGEAGSTLNLDYVNSLSATPNWLPLDTITLASTAQPYFDLTDPLPPQRYYRAWQTGSPSRVPSLGLSGLVPAITLTGNVGDSVRVDGINRYGPIDAWVTLDTVTLTNTSQLYFDVSAPGQPERLYRLVTP
jgi:hypothetical protein